MSAALQALAVMIALLYVPEGMTEFTVSQGQVDESTQKVYAVLLHDGYWRVTSEKNPKGTDYRIDERTFVMRNQMGRLFPSKIDMDIDWSSTNFSEDTTQASFKHPSMGSALQISRGIPGFAAAPQKDKFLFVKQDEGWVKGFLITYSRKDDTNE